MELLYSCIFKIRIEVRSCEFVFVDSDMEENVSEKLIEAVRVRPAIYDRNLDEYSDRQVVSGLWVEICQSLVPSWNKMSSHEKTVKGKMIYYISVV